jgi:hypothetical protein
MFSLLPLLEIEIMMPKPLKPRRATETRTAEHLCSDLIREPYDTVRGFPALGHADNGLAWDEAEKQVKDWETRNPMQSVSCRKSAVTRPSWSASRQALSLRICDLLLVPYAPIWMRRGIAFACFGIVTVSTPSFPVALTLSLSTVSGNTKRR